VAHHAERGETRPLSTWPSAGVGCINKPKLIVITGATAAGKSAFIYEHLTGLPLTIINADSRQVYRGLTISSASPAADDLNKFPHALYNFLPITAAFSAGEFMRTARIEIANALAAGRVPLLCGGTYFYLHAVFYGLLPRVDISAAIQAQVAQMDPATAYNQLAKLDPVAAAANHPHNIYRVKRALMLCLAQGGPISVLEKTGGIADDFEILLLIFDMDRAVLRTRTSQRVKQMFAGGLVEEIQQTMQQSDITQWRSTPALTGIGVREFLEVYEATGKTPAQLSETLLQDVENKIAQNTIHLVKRQQTWYRNAQPKPANTKTVDPSYENRQIAELVKKFIG
jgi:tRNA dimethylallyltransferase